MTPEYLSPLVNHLWQSTLFAGVAGLLTVGLRRNRASVRYWCWMAASVKFLIPFSLLVSFGSQFELRLASQFARPKFAPVMEEISRPFTLLPPASQSIFELSR